MFPYIVADIGGTNARFALATAKQGEQFILEHIEILQGADYPSFEDALAAYIDGLGGVQPKSACVALAGPVDGDRFKMTNLSWEFSRTEVMAKFGFDQFEMLNDFAAVAVSTSRLSGEHLESLVKGQRAAGNKAIFGPGTGLGVAGLAQNGGAWLPIPSEGGHVNIAPATERECDVIKAAIRTHGHVSAETFLSGPGLVNLYKAVCDVRGEAAQDIEPKDVSGRALDGSDEACLETLQHFCAFLGSLAGNLALTYGAKGGVYIAGGILPRFSDFVRASEFESRFRNKGIMSKYLVDIPVDLVIHDQTAFLGAAAWLEQVGA